MSLDIIKQIFNPNDIVRSFNTLEPLKSTIVDSLFTQKITRPSPFMTYSSAKQVLRSVPVVKRDGSPVALGNSELNVDMFAPLPIKVFTNVEASELNDLKALMANKIRKAPNWGFSYSLGQYWQYWQTSRHKS